MTSYKEILEKAPMIEKQLNYFFKNKSLLQLAFIHRSFTNESPECTTHNERLEFLGDSVLGLVIADFLYNKLPDTPEGDLSHIRSRLVEATSCLRYVEKLGVVDHLLLGKGERMNEGRGRQSIMADLFEAIIGAIYLDGGLEAARTFILDTFRADIEAILNTPDTNFKALLQDWCQKKYQEAPIYEVLEETGPDHSKEFRIQVLIQEKQMGIGSGSSKKIAQQAAAEDALRHIQNGNEK